MTTSPPASSAPDGRNAAANADDVQPTDRQRDKLLSALAGTPHQFDFFQAVRLLMRVARQSASSAEQPLRPVGHDYPPQSEIVRFRTLPSHSFPQSEVTAFLPAPVAGDAPSPAEMTVAFLGLTGPVGSLPQHYTQTVIDRLRLKDRTLLDFLDLFNHRTISLFYRAWEKHRVPALLERSQAEGDEDSFTRAIYCLTGLGTPALRNRLELSDETFLYYAGLFAHAPKNAVSLERMLAELFGLPVTVLQFQGQWLPLEPAEQTAMPSAARPGGLNNRLGATTIAGERVWSVESKFRIRLGPLGYEAFQKLLPGGRMLTQLGQAVRTYVGAELDFDAQLVLRRHEVPPCKLAAGEDGGPRLGWNTWACSNVRSTDANEAVFVSDGRPSR
jgi:type VI secretion system protein ImpH